MGSMGVLVVGFDLFLDLGCLKFMVISSMVASDLEYYVFQDFETKKMIARICGFDC